MDIDRLLLVIVQREDSDTSIAALNQAGLSVTVIASSGGFLAAGNVTLLIGLRRDEVDNALELIRSRCQPRTVRTPREARIGRATVFVLPVERHVRVFSTGAVFDTCPGCAEPGEMRFILAIVSQQQSDQLLKTLTDWSYRGTLLSSMGGFLHHRNTTVMIGARSERIGSIVEQVRQVCVEHAESASAATIFVLGARQYARM